MLGWLRVGVEHFKGIVGLFGLFGLAAFLYYCYWLIDFAPSGLELADVLDLVLVAISIGSYVAIFNIYLVANVFVFFSPLVLLLRRARSIAVRSWMDFSVAERPGESGESMEHVFIKAVDATVYLGMFVFAFFFNLFFHLETDVPWSDIAVATLIYGLFLAFAIAQHNRSVRLKKELDRRRSDTPASELEKRESSLWIPIFISRSLFFIILTFPLFILGTGNVIIQGALRNGHFLQESVDVYIDQAFCPVVFDRVGKANLDDVGDYCVLRNVKVLLRRIGDQVLVTGDSWSEVNRVVIPERYVSIQYPVD